MTTLPEIIAEGCSLELAISKYQQEGKQLEGEEAYKIACRATDFHNNSEPYRQSGKYVYSQYWVYVWKELRRVCAKAQTGEEVEKIDWMAIDMNASKSPILPAPTPPPPMAPAAPLAAPAFPPPISSPPPSYSLIDPPPGAGKKIRPVPVVLINSSKTVTQKNGRRVRLLVGETGSTNTPELKRPSSSSAANESVAKKPRIPAIKPSSRRPICGLCFRRKIPCEGPSGRACNACTKSHLSCDLSSRVSQKKPKNAASISPSKSRSPSRQPSASKHTARLSPSDDGNNSDGIEIISSNFSPPPLHSLPSKAAPPGDEEIVSRRAEGAPTAHTRPSVQPFPARDQSPLLAHNSGASTSRNAIGEGGEAEDDSALLRRLATVEFPRLARQVEFILSGLEIIMQTLANRGGA